MAKKNKKTKVVDQAYSARTERLARAALQATRALEESIEKDSRWAKWMVDGVVLVFDHQFDSFSKYRFAAMRVNGYWYLTGTVRRRLSDDEFIEYVGDEEVAVATEWETI